MSATVTSDIEALCGKCGLSWHVVVAMVGDRVAKVECKRCGRQHRYRDPAQKAAASPKKTTGTSRTTGRKSTRAAKVPKTYTIDPTLPSRPYRMTEHFALGEQLEHQRFGLGVVELEIAQGKIQVVFADGKRVLVHGK